MRNLLRGIGRRLGLVAEESFSPADHAAAAVLRTVPFANMTTEEIRAHEDGDALARINWRAEALEACDFAVEEMERETPPRSSLAAARRLRTLVLENRLRDDPDETLTLLNAIMYNFIKMEPPAGAQTLRGAN
ncbi:hypothetical protein [uncultured Albimonas sp.]|uniref:hypothetical protein n=1 Tax=uncultured Albimonas sp. TaxID=1331701 RepID=UPI0030EED80D